MANAEHLAILKKGFEVWNKWREENPDIDVVDFSEADLSEAPLARVNLTKANLNEANLGHANLAEADLRMAYFHQANFIGAILNKADLTEAYLSGAKLLGADLRGARLSGARLRMADLSGAHLSGADLSGADLMGASLNGADLRGASLNKADLTGVDFRRANLTGADLSHAHLMEASFVETVIDQVIISGCSVHGINVWDLGGEFKEQKDLIITPPGAPIVTVDNIKVAQFIYLILNNEAVRDVINTLTSKTVLILGRFAEVERKAILNALRNKLREYNLLPIVFDFDRPVDRNITETVKTLAAISYFVIADITSPKSTPLELQAIVPNFQIPVVPIIQESELPFSMIADLQSQYNGVLDPLTYSSEETLIKALKAAVIDPAIDKHQELRLIKAQRRYIRKAEDFIEDKGLGSQSSLND